MQFASILLMKIVETPTLNNGLKRRPLLPLLALFFHHINSDKGGSWTRFKLERPFCPIKWQFDDEQRNTFDWGEILATDFQSTASTRRAKIHLMTLLFRPECGNRKRHIHPASNCDSQSETTFSHRNTSARTKQLPFVLHVPPTLDSIFLIFPLSGKSFTQSIAFRNNYQFLANFPLNN